jgi:predicted DCC family thiol-disulfide oxidoreductase YuxK
MFLRRDRRQRIRFVDIAAEGFDAASVGVTRDALMDRIHGRLADGSIVDGVEVFRRLYAIIGLGPLVTLSRLPGLSQLLDAAYKVFARNRLRLGDLCLGGTCRARVRPPTAANKDG